MPNKNALTGIAFGILFIGTPYVVMVYHIMKTYEHYNIEHLFHYGIDPLLAMVLSVTGFLAVGRLLVALMSSAFTDTPAKRKEYIMQSAIFTSIILSVILIVYSCKQMGTDYWQEPMLYILLDSFFGLTIVPIVASYVYILILPLYSLADTSRFEKYKKGD